MRKLGAMALAIVALTAMAGCSNAPAAAPSRKQETAKYLSLVEPVNAANAALIDKHPAHQISFAQFKAACHPLMQATTRFDRGVLRIGLTGRAAVDARALVASNASFIATFDALVADSFKSELVVLERENAVSTADVNHLRATLGLPPVVLGG